MQELQETLAPSVVANSSAYFFLYPSSMSEKVYVCAGRRLAGNEVFNECTTNRQRLQSVARALTEISNLSSSVLMIKHFQGTPETILWVS